MAVKYRASQDPAISEFVLPMQWKSRWYRRSRRQQIVSSAQQYQATRPAGFELFSDDRTPYGASVLQQMRTCDILNLHWVAAYVDYESFLVEAARRARLVWTLHDMNAFTGGCHYDLGCGRFLACCGACPQLGSAESEDLSSQIWARKQVVFESDGLRKLCIVTPSRWLGGMAKDSSLFGAFRIETIPYGLDLSDFAPRDRAAARDVLGIPLDAKVVLFLAETVDNRRKGFSLLLDALKQCAVSADGLWVLSVGNNPPNLDRGLRGSHLSYVGSDRFLSLVYSAADVFAIPSLQDNLPNTVMEAMACGVAVVGFNIGGVPDMVRHGTTGLLVPPGDVDGLATSLVQVLNNSEMCRRMGAEGRAIAVEEYALHTQARRYRELYEDLLLH